MDGNGRLRRRKSLQERLGLGCCGGPTWGSRPATMSVGDDEDGYEDVGQGPFLQEAQQQIEVIDVDQNPPENVQEPECISHPPATPGMNLAAALAAERHYREVQDTVLVNGPGRSPSSSPIRPNGPNEVEPATPLRVSLLRLLEESDGVDENEEKRGEVGNDQMCCVCMGRKKGAAFIPCGHTFCRVCSRELWLNRGSCPLCNRSILEILDIF